MVSQINHSRKIIPITIYRTQILHHQNIIITYPIFFNFITSYPDSNFTIFDNVVLDHIRILVVSLKYDQIIMLIQGSTSSTTHREIFDERIANFKNKQSSFNCRCLTRKGGPPLLKIQQTRLFIG